MPGRIYGTVTQAGAANMSFTKGHRNGPSRKNVKARRMPRPNPAGHLRSGLTPIKGMNRGSG